MNSITGLWDVPDYFLKRPSRTRAFVRPDFGDVLEPVANSSGLWAAFPFDTHTQNGC